MRVLVVFPNYSGHPASGIFNKKSAFALCKLCDGLDALAPRLIRPTELHFPLN